MRNKLTTITTLIGLCALVATAQPTEQPPLFDLPTNAPPPVTQAEDLLHFLATVTTNWTVATYVLRDATEGSWGYGFAALYPLNEFMSPGLRIDQVNGQWWQIAGTFSLQYPLNIAGKFPVTPFGYGGIASPLGEGTGSISEVYGAGLLFPLPWKKDWLPDGFMIGWQRWGSTGHNQYGFGVTKKL